jgi:hypothetical protein
MYKCSYLLVWCEEAGCWWQADECEERSLGRAIATLKGRNPRQCRAGRSWAVVAQYELEEALNRKPMGRTVELEELAAA